MVKKRKSPVYIEWDDSHFPEDGGWLTPEQVDLTPMIIRSVGYPIKETKKHITIAAHTASTCMSGLMTIPKSAILKRRTLK